MVLVLRGLRLERNEGGFDTRTPALSCPRQGYRRYRAALSGHQYHIPGGLETEEAKPSGTPEIKIIQEKIACSQEQVKSYQNSTPSSWFDSCAKSVIADHKPREIEIVQMIQGLTCFGILLWVRRDHIDLVGTVIFVPFEKGNSLAVPGEGDLLINQGFDGDLLRVVVGGTAEFNFIACIISKYFRFHPLHPYIL